MAGPIPNLHFAPYNPMQTALEAALGTYKGLTQGRGQRIENELNQAKVPYAGQMAQQDLLNSELTNQLNKYKVQKSGAQAPYYGEMAALEPQITRNDIAYKQAMAQWASIPPWERAAYERQSLNEQELGKQINTELPDQTRDAQIGLSSLAEAKKAYDNLDWKGPVAGQKQNVFGGAFKSADAQILEKNVGTLQASMLKALQKGHINIQDYEQMSKRLPSALLDEKSFDAISNNLSAVMQREAEEEQFKRYGLAQGYSPTQTNQLWSSYNYSRPSLKEGKKNPVLDYSSWKDFYVPENAARVLKDPTYEIKVDMPKTAKREGSSFVKIQAPNGKVVSVPEDRVQDAIKAGGKRV